MHNGTVRSTAARGCIGGSTADALTNGADRNGRTHAKGRKPDGSLLTVTRLAPPVRFFVRKAVK